MPNLVVFSGNAHPQFAHKVVSHLHIPLGSAQVATFSDGEISIEITENVRGKDVFIVQPTCAPTNDNLMEILVMADALRRSSAGRITAVIPYFGYARQDRRPRSARVPITAKVVADMLTTVGIDRVVMIDLHADQIQGFFDIPVDNLLTEPLFASYYMQKGLCGEDVVIVSPKNSGIKRARNIAEFLNAPIAIIDYAQDDSDRAEGYIIGNVAGKKAILVDDILNTGRTFSQASKIVEDGGATEIYAVASHGLFAGTAAQLLDESSIKEILVTDSVASKEQHPKNIAFLTASDLIADAIHRIQEHRPLSPLFKFTNPEKEN